MTDPVARFREGAARSDRMFWLDGGGSRLWSGRRSIIGVLDEDDVSLTFDAEAREVTRHRSGRSEPAGDDIFTALADEMAADRGDPAVHWVGYFGYAARTDLPARPALDVPDAVWMRVRDPYVVEHGDVAGDGAPVVSALEPEPLPDWYVEAFETVQDALRGGLTYELNLTYREIVRSDVDPVTAYLRLRAINPAPYAGFLQHRGTWLLSSSPERYALIDRHRMLQAKPIKGTTPRGATTAEDEELRTRLGTDPKFRAENLMIVDLLRNDLSMVCEPGTVEIPGLMEVESYTSVHQLVSTVRGRLRDGISTIDALRALFPAGSMTGAPKLSTMLITDDVETSPRGVYAGAFGWICADGRADLGVVIRSLVATADAPGWRYELGTGGGITVRSEVAEEWAESRWKAARVRGALLGPAPIVHPRNDRGRAAGGREA